MNNTNKSILIVLDSVADILFNCVALLAAYVLAPFFSGYYAEPLTASFYLFCLCTVLFLSFGYQVANFYHPSKYLNGRDAFFTLVRADLATTFILSVGIVLIGNLRGSDETTVFLVRFVILSFLTSVALLSFKRDMIIRANRYIRKKNVHLRKIIIVGDNTESAKEYIRQLKENPQYGYMVLGFVGDRIRFDVGVDKLGSFENLGEILDRYQPNDVIFAIDSYNKKRLIRLVNQCEERCIKVYFLPVIYGYFKTPRQIETIGQMPLINIHATPLDNPVNATLKRASDILLSVFFLVLLSPLALVTACLIKLSSKGPVLSREERVGKMGKTFSMVKFRTTKENQSSPESYRLGAFLRMSGIDEIPQLYNVLIGDMSLVGPRPELPGFVDEVITEIPLYMVKHYVKPGITGLSQVRGLRFGAPVGERIKCDISYIENWSFLGDLGILLRTPFCAFSKAQKYDVPGNQFPKGQKVSFFDEEIEGDFASEPGEETFVPENHTINVTMPDENSPSRDENEVM